MPRSKNGDRLESPPDLHGARGVRSMPLPAVAGGVQHADVEHAGNRRGIGLVEVLGDIALREAAAVDDRLETFKGKSLRLTV